MSQRHAPVGPQQIAIRAQAAENRAKAWEFRKLGATYAAIGKKLSVSHEAVRNYIQAALDRLKADELRDAGEYRRMELARLDDLLLAITPRALKGELAVIDRVLRIQERRSKFLGLDAPTKVEIENDFSPETLKKLSMEELKTIRKDSLAQLLAAGALTDLPDEATP